MGNIVWFHRNISHAFQTILKDEGGLFSGCLYKGLPPTVMVCLTTAVEPLLR